MTPKFGENWLTKCRVVFSFWGGGLRPQTPWPGALPMDPAGGTAPLYGSRYHARHSPPNAKTKLRLCL